MDYIKIFEQVKSNLTAVIKQEPGLGRELWQELVKMHPADIAQLISDLNKNDFEGLFKTFPHSFQIQVFEYLTDPEKAFIISTLADHDKINILKQTPIDELIDLFEFLSNTELKHIFNLLQKREREQAISLMKFDSESAGGMMDVNVISLQQDLTVEKSVKILQHIRPNQELHHQLYVTDRNNKLIGHINLEDLVIHHPKQPIIEFLRKNEYIAHVNDHQRDIVQKMTHYHLLSTPVVSSENYFIGVVPSETLIEALEEEATEDIYKISAMTPIKQTYFETSFVKLVYDRSYILIILLLVESFSSTVLKAHEASLAGLVVFIPMLVSTGGNTSSQTSALAIQGLASGEINFSNIMRFIRREFIMALFISIVLGLTAFARVFWSPGTIITECWVVSLTLAIIVMTSVVLGSCIPLVLKHFKIDPAFSAGPFLSTMMDILGIVIYCYISKLILL
jgi:magnesium transporter